MSPAGTNREEVLARVGSVSRIIGSPGFPADPAEVRSRALEAYERSFYPIGVARQMAAVTSNGSRKPALQKLDVAGAGDSRQGGSVSADRRRHRHARSAARVAADGDRRHGSRPAAAGVAADRRPHQRADAAGELIMADRIRTTHAGSLPRPAELVALHARRFAGERIDAAELAQRAQQATRRRRPPAVRNRHRRGEQRRSGS